MSILSKQKRDGNEKEIVTALRAAGVTVMYMDKSAGFDLLCAWAGKLTVIEVKQPKAKLEIREQIVRDYLGQAGVDYNVVTSIDEALDLFWT